MSPLFDWFNENSRNSRSSGGNKSKGGRGNKARSLRMEALEERQLLSVNPLGIEDRSAVVVGPQWVESDNFTPVDLSAIPQSTALAGELPQEPQAAALPDLTGAITENVANITQLNAAIANANNRSDTSVPYIISLTANITLTTATTTISTPNVVFTSNGVTRTLGASAAAGRVTIGSDTSNTGATLFIDNLTFTAQVTYNAWNQDQVENSLDLLGRAPAFSYGTFALDIKAPGDYAYAGDLTINRNGVTITGGTSTLAIGGDLVLNYANAATPTITTFTGLTISANNATFNAPTVLTLNNAITNNNLVTLPVGTRATINLTAADNFTYATTTTPWTINKPVSIVAANSGMSVTKTTVSTTVNAAVTFNGFTYSNASNFTGGLTIGVTGSLLLDASLVSLTGTGATTVNAGGALTFANGGTIDSILTYNVANNTDFAYAISLLDTSTNVTNEAKTYTITSALAVSYANDLTITRKNVTLTPTATMTIDGDLIVTANAMTNVTANSFTLAAGLTVKNAIYTVPVMDTAGVAQVNRIYANINNLMTTGTFVVTFLGTTYTGSTTGITITQPNVTFNANTDVTPKLISTAGISVGVGSDFTLNGVSVQGTTLAVSGTLTATGTVTTPITVTLAGTMSTFVAGAKLNLTYATLTGIAITANATWSGDITLDNASFTYGGNFTTALNGKLSLDNSSSFTYTGTSIITVGGTDGVEVKNSTFTVRGGLTVNSKFSATNSTVTANVVTIAGTANFVNSPLLSQNLAGTAVAITVSAGGSLTTTGNINGSSLTVNGTLNATGGTITAGGLVTVGAAGSLNIGAPATGDYGLYANLGITVNAGGNLAGGQYVSVTGAVTWNVATNPQFTSALDALKNSTDTARFTITSTAAVSYPGDYTISRKNVTLIATGNSMTFTGKLIVTKEALINGNGTNNISFIISAGNSVKVDSAEFTVIDFADFNGSTAAAKIAQFNSISAVINGISGKDADSGMQTVNFLGAFYDLGATAWTTLVSTTKTTFVSLAGVTEITTTATTPAFTTYDAIFTNMKLTMVVTTNVTNNDSLGSAIALANNSSAGTRTFTINVNKTDLTIADDTTIARNNVTLRINIADGTLNIAEGKELTISGTTVSLQGFSTSTNETLDGGTLVIANTATSMTYTNLTSIKSSLDVYVLNTTALTNAFTALGLRPDPSPTNTTTATFYIAGGTYSRTAVLTINKDLTIKSGSDQSVATISFTTQTVTIGSGATVDLGDKVSIATTSGPINVNGTLNLSGDAWLWTTINSGSITINGTLNASGTGKLETSGGNITINGTLNLTDVWAWTTSGTVTVATTGTVYLRGNARLQSSNSPVNINGTAHLTDTGHILTASSTITVNGTVNMEDTAKMQVNSNSIGASIVVNGTVNMEGEAFIILPTVGKDVKITVKSSGKINLSGEAYISVQGHELIVEGTITATGDAPDSPQIRLDVSTNSTIGKVTVNSGGRLSVTGSANVVSVSNASTKGQILVNSGGVLIGTDVYENFKVDFAFNCTTEADVMNAFAVGQIDRTDLPADAKKLIINVNNNIILSAAISIVRPHVWFDNTGFTTGYTATDIFAWGRLEFKGGVTVNRNNLSTYFADTINVTRKPGTVDVSKPKLEIVGISELTVNVDDSAAITGAASLVQNGDGVVHVPAGTYTKGFSVTGNKPGITIRGELDVNSQLGSVIQAVGGSTGVPAHTMISSPSVNIENIWFDHIPESTSSYGPTNNSRHYALGFYSVGGVIDSCKFTSSVTESKNNHIGPLQLNAGTVQNSLFIDNGLWSQAIHYTGNQAISIIDNVITRPSTVTNGYGNVLCIEGSDGAVPQDVEILIQGNTFYGGWCNSSQTITSGKISYTIKYINNDFIKVDSNPMRVQYGHSNIILNGNIFPSDITINYPYWIDTMGNYWGSDGMDKQDVFVAGGGFWRDLSYWALTADRDPVTKDLINLSPYQLGRVLSKDSVYITKESIPPYKQYPNDYIEYVDAHSRILYTNSTIFTTLEAGMNAISLSKYVTVGTVRLADEEFSVRTSGSAVLTLSKSVNIIGLGANSTLLGSLVIGANNVTLQNFTLRTTTAQTYLIQLSASRSNVTIDGLTIICDFVQNPLNPTNMIVTAVNGNYGNINITNNTFKSLQSAISRGMYINYYQIRDGATFKISGNTFGETGYEIITGILSEGSLAASTGTLLIEGNKFINTRTGIALNDQISSSTTVIGDIKNVTIKNNIFGSASLPLSFYAISIQNYSAAGVGVVYTDTVLINNNQIFGRLRNEFTGLGKDYIINFQNNYFGEGATAYNIADTMIGAFDYSHWATSTNGFPTNPALWDYCPTVTKSILKSWIEGTVDGNYYVPTETKKPSYSNFAEPDPMADAFDIYYEDINIITGHDYMPKLPYTGYIPAGSKLISFLYPQTWESGDPRIGLSADGFTLIAKVPLTYNITLPFTVTSVYSGTIACTVTLDKLNPVAPTMLDLGNSYDPTKTYTAGAIISTTVTFWGYTATGVKVRADVYSAASSTSGYTLTSNGDGTWTLKTTAARTISGNYSVGVNALWLGSSTPVPLTLVYAVRAADPSSVYFNGAKVETGTVSISTTTMSRKLGIFTAQTETHAPANVWWSISGVDMAKFTIDANTGVLSLVPGTPKRTEPYHINVIANAIANPDTRSITTAVTIDVIELPQPDPTNPLYLVDVNGLRIDATKVYARGAVIGYLPGYDGIAGTGVIYQGFSLDDFIINPNFNVVYDAKLQKWAIVAAVSLTASSLHDLKIEITTSEGIKLDNVLFADVPIRAIDPLVIKYNKQEVAFESTVLDYVVPGTTTIGSLEAFNLVGTAATTRWSLDEASIAKGFFIKGNTIYYDGKVPMEDEDIYDIKVTAKAYVLTTEVKATFTLHVEVILPPERGAAQSLAELNGVAISSTKTYSKGTFVGYLDFEGITYGQEDGLYIDDTVNFQCVYDLTVNRYKILANKALSTSAVYDFTVLDKTGDAVQNVRVYVKAVNVYTINYEAQSVRVNGLVDNTPTFDVTIVSGASVTMVPLAQNGTTATVGAWEILSGTTKVASGNGSTISFKPFVAGTYTVKVYDASSIDPTTGNIDEDKVVRFNITVTIESVTLTQTVFGPGVNKIAKGDTITIFDATPTVAKKTISSSQLPAVGGITITLSNTLVNVTKDALGTVKITAASALTITTTPIYIGLTVNEIVVILEIYLKDNAIQVNFL